MPENSSSDRSTRLDPNGGQGNRPKPQFPNHELLRSIGSGAFGEVWLARNIMGTYRAVKIIYRRNFSDQRPYEREFRGLQKFEPISRSHDGFVDILDTGLDEAQGCFYYVMEVADDVESGNKIDPESYKPKTLDKEKAEGGCVPVQTCVSLGVSLSAALAYLHQHGLLHRDIKPTNIIFVNGIPKIADIGLVTKVEATMTDSGTTGYFPPEGPGTVQADLYALGKVLYELSTGQDRCEFPELPADLDSMQDPDRFRELNQVILKACEGDPHNRYRKAEDMHADLLLLLAGKSVRRVRVLERRIAQLKKVGIAAALIILVAAGTLFGWNRHLRRVAEQRRQQVGSNLAHGNNLVNEGDFFGALPFFWEGLRLEQDDPVGEKNDRLRIGSLLEQCPRITKMWVLKGQNLYSADLSRDGRHLIIGSGDGTTTLCDVTNGTKFEPWARDESHRPLQGISLSPDGRYAATAGETIVDGQGFVKIWDMATHSLLSTASPPKTVYGVTFSPDGSQFVTASGNGDKGFVYIYDTREPGRGAELTNAQGAFRWVVFNTNGTRLVTTCEDGIAQVWDFKTKLPIGDKIKHPSWVYCAAFSSDGQRVVTGSADGTVKVCDTETGRPILVVQHPVGAGVKSVAFSPDGRYIITAGWDYTARIWEAATGRLVYPTLKQSGKFPIYVSFTPDAHQVIMVNANGIVSLWDLAAPIKHSQTEDYTIASQDGQRFCAIKGSNIDVFVTTNRSAGYKILAGGVQDAILNKEGGLMVTFSQPVPPSKDTKIAQLWDIASARSISPKFNVESALGNAFLSDDGQRLVTWPSESKQATVWDTYTGGRLLSLNHADNVSEKGGSFSPNRTWLATISSTNVYIWNRDNKNFEHVVPNPDNVEHVAFSADSRLLVICVGSPGTLIEREARIWDVASRRQVGPPLQHDDGVRYAEFSPDGTLLVTASEDATARIWSVPWGRLLWILKHQSTVTEVHFSSDSRWVLTMCEGQVNGTARVWDAQTGEALTPPLRHPWRLKDAHAQFFDGYRKILTRTSRERGGKSMLWDLPIERGSLTNLAELVKLLSGHQLDLTGAVLPQRPEELQKTFEGLTAERPPNFIVSQDDVINWYLREAEASERAEQADAEVFHWQHLVDAKPDDQNYQDHLQRAREQLRRTNEAKP
jgi:WD40 repeat protein